MKQGEPDLKIFGVGDIYDQHFNGIFDSKLIFIKVRCAI